MDPEQQPTNQQPALFSADEFEGALVESAKVYAHTGTTVCKNEERCAAILTDILSGMSMRAVAVRHKVSMKSIRRIISVFEQAGKLAPLKARLSSKLGYAAELGVEEFVDALEKGKIAPAALPVPIAIFLDKKLLLDGDATQRVEHVRREISAEQVEELFAQLRSAHSIPIAAGAAPEAPSDCGSVENQGFPSKKEGL
jgi:hypothetical protein